MEDSHFSREWRFAVGCLEGLVCPIREPRKDVKTELPKLALDSPRWEELTVSSGKGSEWAIVNPIKRMCEGDRDAWEAVCAQVIHQGTLWNSGYAALPWMVESLVSFSNGEQSQLTQRWIDLGFIAAECSGTIPADLAPGVDAALKLAELHCLRFLLRVPIAEQKVSYVVLSCFAFAGNPNGSCLWHFFDPRLPGKPFIQQRFFTCLCPRCEDDLEWHHLENGIADYCYGSENKTPMVEVPLWEVTERSTTCGDQIRHDFESTQEGGQVITQWLESHPLRTFQGKPFPEGFVETYTDQLKSAIAAARTIKDANRHEVLSLLGIMVACQGHFEWASRLLLLTGEFQCPACKAKIPFEQCLDY